MPLIVTDAKSILTFRLKAFQTGTTPAFADGDLTQAITLAVQEYSRHRPARTLENLAALANVQSYDWPSGAINVVETLFSLESPLEPYYTSIGLTPDLFFPLVQQQWASFWESPAVLTRAQIYTSQWADSWLGHMTVDRNERKIFLNPVPTQAVTGKILVDRFHAEAPSGQYATINDGDVDAVLEWAEAELLGILANAYMVQDIKIGNRHVAGVDISNALTRKAEAKKASFRRRVAAPAGARS